MRTRRSCLPPFVRLVLALIVAPSTLRCAARVARRRRVYGVGARLAMFAAFAAFAGSAAFAAGCAPRATTPLTMAAARGDVAEIERLIAAGADPNSGGDSAFTPLMWAARGGHVNAVRRLVALGADPNRTSGVNDWSPLLHALHKHGNQAALTLIELGAHIKGRPGQRALAMAVGYGNAEMTRALLARQVDPHFDLGGGPSLLARAAAGIYDLDYRWTGCRPHTATVRALVDHAPDLHLNDTVWDRYAVVYVRERRCAEMLTLLEPRIAVRQAAAP